MPVLEVEHVAKSFPTRAEELVVLRDVSLALDAGQNVAILGPSGSGKSTLLHIIGTLDPPSGGSVRIGGQDPYQLDEPSLAAFRNRQLGFIFQEHYLLPQLSVLENVLIPLLADGRPDGSSVDRAHALLESVGLADRLDHRPAELSGGERGRAAVARALMLKPALLLADEPTGNLDQTNARAVGQLLVELPRQEQAIVVMVTHSHELAALSDRQWYLQDGRLVDHR